MQLTKPKRVVEVKDTPYNLGSGPRQVAVTVVNTETMTRVGVALTRAEFEAIVAAGRVVLDGKG